MSDLCALCDMNSPCLVCVAPLSCTLPRALNGVRYGACALSVRCLILLCPYIAVEALNNGGERVLITRSSPPSSLLGIIELRISLNPALGKAAQAAERDAADSSYGLVIQPAGAAYNAVDEVQVLRHAAETANAAVERTAIEASAADTAMQVGARAWHANAQHSGGWSQHARHLAALACVPARVIPTRNTRPRDSHSVRRVAASRVLRALCLPG